MWQLLRYSVGSRETDSSATTMCPPPWWHKDCTSAGGSWPMTQQWGTNACSFLPHVSPYNAALASGLPIGLAKNFLELHCTLRLLRSNSPSFPLPIPRVRPAPGFGVSPPTFSYFSFTDIPPVNLSHILSHCGISSQRMYTDAGMKGKM